MTVSVHMKTLLDVFSREEVILIRNALWVWAATSRISGADIGEETALQLERLADKVRDLAYG